MNVWALIYLLWWVFGLGIAISRWVSGNGVIKLTAFDILVSPILSMSVLYMAGFFDLLVQP